MASLVTLKPALCVFLPGALSLCLSLCMGCIVCEVAFSLELLMVAEVVVFHVMAF